MNEEATLLYIVNKKDADGFPIEAEEKLTVYVREKSAARTEFYEALRSGITVRTVFEVRQEDWNLTRHLTVNKKSAYATKIIYDGDLYDIIRAYKNDKSMIELICS